VKIVLPFTVTIPRKTKAGRKPNTIDKFWQRVAKTESCWLWKGTVNKYNGRGMFKLNDKYYQVHRLSYELKFGAIPDGILICHKCDIPLCVNPDHLFPGTQQDNINDCVSKKRNAFGYKNWNTKLTEEKVRIIRKTDFSAHGSQAMMARLMGISQTALQYVLNRKNWSHI